MLALHTAVRGLLLAALSCLCVSMPATLCQAYAPDDWELVLEPTGTGGSPRGFVIGVHPSYSDGSMWGPMAIDQPGRYALRYLENGQNWSGQTGFYNGSFFKTPIAAGGSRTWADIYLWAQNVVLPTPYRTDFLITRSSFDWTPYGYTGHLVLDYVPPEAQWDGPMEFWLDLGLRNVFTLPIPVVTNPLQGTRMHPTVYAPVPEPSSLLALAAGLAGVGWRLMRR